MINWRLTLISCIAQAPGQDDRYEAIKGRGTEVQSSLARSTDHILLLTDHILSPTDHIQHQTDHNKQFYSTTKSLPYRKTLACTFTFNNPNCTTEIQIFQNSPLEVRLKIEKPHILAGFHYWQSCGRFSSSRKTWDSSRFFSISSGYS